MFFNFLISLRSNRSASALYFQLLEVDKIRARSKYLFLIELITLIISNDFNPHSARRGMTLKVLKVEHTIYGTFNFYRRLHFRFNSINLRYKEPITSLLKLFQNPEVAQKIQCNHFSIRMTLKKIFQHFTTIKTFSGLHSTQFPNFAGVNPSFLFKLRNSSLKPEFL